MGRILGALFAVLAAALLTAAPAHAQAIDAELFARNAAIKDVALSPDGRYVAMIQRVEGGEALVVVDWRARESHVIQYARADRFLVLEWVAWKTGNRLLFALRQRAFWNGTATDDSWQDIRRVFAVDRDGQNLTQMFEGQMRRLATESAPIDLIDIQNRDPENVLIGTYGQSGYTVYRANVTTGRVTQIDAFGSDVFEMLVDGAGTPVMRLEALPYSSGLRVYRRAPGGGRWLLAHEETRSSVAENHDFSPIGAGPGVGQIYVAARPEGQEFQAIYLYNTATGELGQPVYAHPRADASVIGRDPNDDSLLFGCGQTQRLECRASDPRIQRHFEAIEAFFEGLADFRLLDVSTDKNTWLIAAAGPTVPSTFYVYDLNARHLTLVASTRPFLPRTRLSEMEVVRYTASDGAELWGYLTTPAGPPGPRPLIVLPHGGPEARDGYAYSFMVQFLASRGYSVFQPNYRGSEGSGRSFAAAGHLQWGRRMQADISDGVRRLIETGAADPQRICIAGGSYGGYAALAGATLTPELYRCVIAIAGVSDLVQMMASERAQEGRRSATYAYWQRLIGDPARDREALLAVSPARQVAAARAPILLIHGSDDWTVPIEQSEIMRDALQRAGKPVEYLRIEHENHFWSTWEPENRQLMLASVERFLLANLGPGVTPPAPAP